jgi:L-cysteine:1D-myo-inositol 2-amino-2-deoxy-alpha-D-glucopyranoside ligase
MSQDLNAPGALAAVDRWATNALDLHESKLPENQQLHGEGSALDAALISDALDALLGIQL